MRHLNIDYLRLVGFAGDSNTGQKVEKLHTPELSGTILY